MFDVPSVGSLQASGSMLGMVWGMWCAGPFGLCVCVMRCLGQYPLGWWWQTDAPFSIGFRQAQARTPVRDIPDSNSRVPLWNTSRGLVRVCRRNR